MCTNLGEFNIKGAVCGILAAFFGAANGVLIKKYITGEDKLNAIQLLYYQAPLSAILLSVVSYADLVVREQHVFIERPFFHWFVLVLSGIAGFLINLSVCYIIGKTSALK